MPPTPHRRLAQLAAGLLLLAGSTLGAAPAASAAAPVVTFATIDSTPVDCTGARITAITDAAGVRYYHHGHRLHFPTQLLRYDKLGIIELTARPTRGHTLTQTHGQLLAPTACFTAITAASEPRLGPTNSWCAGSTAPVLQQVFSSDELETQTASWRLVRRASHQVVARGTVSIYLGVGLVDFPLPAGLPLGRYVLTVRNTASSVALFPYSMKAEQYRCLPTPTVRTGAVVFSVPAHGPAARIEIFEGPPQEPTAVLTVRPGHRARYRTTATALDYAAYPVGNHVGVLGAGHLEVPQT